MLFNSHLFIALFLPIAWLGFGALSLSRKPGLAYLWLLLASLFFYWQNSGPYVAVLLASLGGNYLFSLAIHRTRDSARLSSLLLWLAIAANLGLLGYFKYLGFILENLDASAELQRYAASVALPLGISFFTFQQIAYLVDLRGGSAAPAGLLSYGLFTAFFPHITAGPIVHHREVLPIYAGTSAPDPIGASFLPGLTLFAMGLFKKVLLADTLTPYADQAFAAAGETGAIAVGDAWLGAGAYTLQLYFDFSGYSDMAVGLALMFGIRLPVNFASPYKARSIIAFWQRWHISLTRFFTAYLYLPMGVALSRRTAATGLDRRSRMLLQTTVPIFITFLLAGIWHGAGWTFVLFGLLHGAALAVNHAWRVLSLPRLPAGAAWAVTAFVVLVGMILFRADDTATAATMILGLFGAAGDAAALLDPTLTSLLVIGLLVPVLLLPNSQEIVGYGGPQLDGNEAAAPAATPALWRPDAVGVGWTALVLALAALAITDESRFLYYRY